MRYHVLKSRITIIRHVMMVKRHSHINISSIDVKIAITRYETMIAKHEATHEMYSPKSPKNVIKSRNTRNMCIPPIHIFKYIYIYIN